MKIEDVKIGESYQHVRVGWAGRNKFTVLERVTRYNGARRMTMFRGTLVPQYGKEREETFKAALLVRPWAEAEAAFAIEDGAIETARKIAAGLTSLLDRPFYCDANAVGSVHVHTVLHRDEIPGLLERLELADKLLRADQGWSAREDGAR